MYNPTHKCPYCGSTNIYAYQNLSLSAMPTTWHCNNCQKEFYNAIPLTANEAIQPQYTEKTAKYGWICPVCGVGVNPTEKTCPKCNSINYTTIATAVVENITTTATTDTTENTILTPSDLILDEKKI